MLPTHRFIDRQGEYTISLRQPGFEFTPMLLGKIASFVVAGTGSGYAVFAFMYPLLATDVPDEEQLIEAAVGTITAAIESGQIAAGRERTFEFRSGAFVEVAEPRWWIRVGSE